MGCEVYFNIMRFFIIIKNHGQTLTFFKRENCFILLTLYKRYTFEIDTHRVIAELN